MTGASWVAVYDRLKTAITVRHYSPKTLQAYKMWMRKLQTCTKSKDPQLVSQEDVKEFLSFLAVDRHVAASSQNQAFNALLFLFRHVLEKEFGKVEGVVGNRVRSCNNIVCHYHSLMAHPLRLEFPGAVYHLTSCGNAPQAIYRDNGKKGTLRHCWPSEFSLKHTRNLNFYEV